jgi:hypothetical protein
MAIHIGRREFVAWRRGFMAACRSRTTVRDAGDRVSARWLCRRAADSFSQRPRRGAVQRTPKLAAALKAARKIRDEAFTRPRPGRIQS